MGNNILRERKREKWVVDQWREARANERDTIPRSMYFQQHLQRHPTSILQIVAARDRRREPTWRMKIPKSKIPIVSRYSFYVHSVPDRVLCIAKISRCFVIEKFSMQRQRRKKGKKKKKVRSTFRSRSSLIRFQFFAHGKTSLHHLQKSRYIYIVFRRTNSFILPKI